MKKIILVILVVFSTNVFSGGFRIALQGTKQSAMGHTGVGITVDASSIFFNPSGLSFMKTKWSISGGVSLVDSNVDFVSTITSDSYNTSNPIGTPINLYIANKINDKFSIGLGIYTPFGNTVKWGKDWEGSPLVTEISLKTLFIQPTVSYRINEWFSVGAGFIYAVGSVNLQKNIVLPFPSSSDLELDSSKASGIGFNVGFTAKPDDKLTIGVNYRSKINMKVDGGDATFNVPAIPALKPIFQVKNDKFDAELPLPAEITFGLSYKVTDKLLLAFDVNHTKWSDYESLDFTFENNNVGLATNPNTTSPKVSSSKRNYKNTLTYRVGASYDITDKLTGKIGYYYDETPSPDEYFSPETPTLTNNAFTAGATYKVSKKLDLDFSYMYLNGQERNFTNVENGFSGQINANTYIYNIGFSYNF